MLAQPKRVETTPPETFVTKKSTYSSSSPSPKPAVPDPNLYQNTKEQHSPLPQSAEIWSKVDEPSNRVQQSTTFQETPRSASRSYESAVEEDGQIEGRKRKTTAEQNEETSASDSKEKAQRQETLPAKKNGTQPFGQPEGQKEFSPFGPPDKAISPTAKSPQEQKEAELESLLLPTFTPFEHPAAVSTKKGMGAIPMQPEEMAGKISLPQGKTPEEIRAFSSTLEGIPPKEEEKKKAVPVAEPARLEKKSPSPPPFEEEEKLTTVLPKQEAREEGEQNKKRSKQEAPPPIASPSQTPLIPSAIPVAQAAAAAATPYLGIEALAIYFHMIGTITAMVSPSGDSRTEFFLDSPNFAKSKFFGSTITIEKFATAPDALNIRLTGSTEAVNAFNKDIPNLLAAFERGKFAFVVNRIEAVYEKPLFRRKESAGDKGSGEGFKKG